MSRRRDDVSRYAVKYGSWKYSSLLDQVAFVAAVALVIVGAFLAASLYFNFAEVMS
jgi:hypothetical protein